MYRSGVKNKPTYSLDSVDHALRLAVLLQQEGPFGVTDAAARLGVARSTAHRLLTMLVYRDFADQGDDRRYAAGPVLRSRAAAEPVAGLREIAVGHLRELVERLGETANVMVLHGTQVRFVATVQCEHVLRVGDREGRILPAHLASGGQAMLARLSRAELEERYAGDSTGAEREAVQRSVRRTRRRGFAINDQVTETGLTALGHAVTTPDQQAHAALSIAMPSARYKREMVPDLVAALGAAARAIEHDLRASEDSQQ